MHTPTSRRLKIWAGLGTLCTLFAGFAAMVGPLALAGFLATAFCLLPLVAGPMMVIREVRRFTDNFDRAQAFTTTPGENGWTIKDTSSGGTPTYLCVDGGAKLTLDNTSEAQIVTLFHNDVLQFDVAQLQLVTWIAKVADIDSVTTLVFGVGAAQNDTSDSVVTNAWFRIQGSASMSNVVVETDDATNDLDDKATGTTLAAVFKKFTIDFTNGLGDVRFYIDGARVAASTTFDMSDLTAGLNVQPFVQLQKASGTGTPSVTLAKCEIQYASALGA